jgi:hypothetical protein
MRWAGHVEGMRTKMNAHRIFMSKPEGKRPQGRSRYKWEGNIKYILE